MKRARPQWNDDDSYSESGESDSSDSDIDENQCAETPQIDSDCNVKNAVISCRAAFYPNNYVLATKTWKANQLIGMQDTCGAGNFRCPGCNACKNNAAATIEHIIPVAQHWNQHGRDQSRAQRNTWYNDTTNHSVMCGPCNSGLGSGGVLYDRTVTPNFTN
jgi:HNH/ENDO VII superfamily nuclease with conserved GHE residues